MDGFAMRDVRVCARRESSSLSLLQTGPAASVLKVEALRGYFHV